MKQSQIISALFLLLTVIIAYHSYNSMTIATFAPNTNQKIILLDPGHGGWDPGKLGKHGSDEKDINLKIAENLQAYLDNGGAITLMTRIGDEALSDKKRGDLSERVAIADSGRADITVSIHQNAFPQESVKGAQVFYHSSSEESKKLAEAVQNRINTFADATNRRMIKPNDDYYILKNTSNPAIIVECGFLSNYAEEKKLNTESYQNQIAWAIYCGISDYFKQE